MPKRVVNLMMGFRATEEVSLKGSILFVNE